MKIKLQLSEKQLSALVYSFNALGYDPAQRTREIKVARNVLDRVSLKFKKKQLELSIVPPTIFHRSTVKKHGFSLEYFEAHYLERFITIAMDHPLNEYDRNVLRLINTNLNQQLS
ncbi:MAG: hypothetical protein ITG00_03350 [Flavobacterium sp.]|nr:hypothetical protein [Flavobacterium sp.]